MPLPLTGSPLGTVRRLFRRAPRIRSVHFSYEKAGLRVPADAIPWNADAFYLEIDIDAGTSLSGYVQDYYIIAPGRTLVRAYAVEPLDMEGNYRALFRLGPGENNSSYSVLWRTSVLGHVAPVWLRPNEFLDGMKLESPTVFARLGQHYAACQAVVEGQPEHLTACALLRGNAGLLPILDWDFTLELGQREANTVYRLPIRLTGSQVAGQQALVSTPLPRFTFREGTWTLRWLVRDCELARSELRVVSADSFRKSLYVALAEPCESSTLDFVDTPFHAKHPSLRIASREPNIAAWCPLEAVIHFRDPTRMPQHLKTRLFITDLTCPAQGAEAIECNYQEVKEFDFFSDGYFVTSVDWHPSPTALFDSEGGYHAIDDFDWTPARDIELNDRLNQLGEVAVS